MINRILISLYAICLSACTGISNNAACDGGAFADVFTWNDTNSNGVFDKDEEPLPYVTFDQNRFTGLDGHGSTGYWVYGCCADCWKDLTLSVKVPRGYVATTPIEYRLTGFDDDYSFGFRLVDLDEVDIFPSEPEWYKAFTNRGLVVTEFHFTNDAFLQMTADWDETLANAPLGSDPNAASYYYRLYIYDVISDLVFENAITINAIHVSLVPSGTTFACRMHDSENPLVPDTNSMSETCSEAFPP